MDIKKIKLAPYNPRKMNKESKKALKKSLDEFNDISGITINKRTGNVISGNHRWEELLSKHKKANLVLTPLNNEYHSLDMKNGTATGFLIRVVDWDEPKEKAANIAANSDLLTGEFTSGLQDLLLEISPELDMDLFDDLRLDELTIDMEDIDDDYDWEPETAKDIQAEANRKNQALTDAKGEEPGEIKEIISNIKLVVMSDLKDELIADITEFLDSKPEYKDVKVI